MRQPLLSPDGALAFAGVLLLLSVAFTHMIRELRAGLIVLPSSWRERRSQTRPRARASGSVEASMAVFTTELATVITRLDELQNTLGTIEDRMTKEQACTLAGGRDGSGRFRCHHNGARLLSEPAQKLESRANCPALLK